MLCSNCGKDVPLAGKVCPWCGHDKSKDQMVYGSGMLGALLGGLLGYAVYSFVGAIVGGFIGLVTFLIIAMVKKGKMS